MKKLKYNIPYSGKFGGGEFGDFGESSAIRQTKTIQISTTTNNLLADLLICQMLETSQFAKLSPTKLSHYTVIQVTRGPGIFIV